MENFLDSGAAEVLTALLALLTALANVYTQITTGRQIDDLIKTVDHQMSNNNDNYKSLSRHMKRSQEQIDRLIDAIVDRETGGEE